MNIIPRQREISQDFINFGKKVLPGIFLGYELIAGGIWKGRYSDCVPGGRFGKVGCIRNLFWKNQRGRSIDNPQRGSIHISYSQLQMVQQNCQEETTNPENPLLGGNRP